MIVEREALGGPVDDVDAGAVACGETPEAEQPAHERRRLDGCDVGAGGRRPHRAGAETRADVDDSFAALRVDQTDDRVVDVRPPHLREPAEVPQCSTDALIVRVTVVMIVMIVLVIVVLVRHGSIMTPAVPAGGPGQSAGTGRPRGKVSDTLRGSAMFGRSARDVTSSP